MTDMRRTILWVVFTASLFLLWDAWNKHNGQSEFIFSHFSIRERTSP